MNPKTAKTLGLVLMVLSIAVNLYGYFTLPQNVIISTFGESPVPTVMLLVLALAFTALGLYRLLTEDKPPVCLQWVVILAVIVVANGVLVFIG